MMTTHRPDTHRPDTHRPDTHRPDTYGTPEPPSAADLGRPRARIGAWILGLAIFTTFTGVACGEDQPAVDCAAGAAPRYIELTIIDSCVTCHSSRLTGPARRGAPEDINWDTYEGAKKDAAEGASQVAALKMPYPSGQGVSEEDRQQFYRWAACGTPE